MRQWIAGHSVPGRIQLLEWGAVAVGFVILGLVDTGLGWVLTANLWGIRIARANRGAVDQALSALETSAVRTKPTPSATRVKPLTPILRNNLLLERRRAIAWLIASVIAVASAGRAAARDHDHWLRALVGVLRRLMATWLAFHNFTNAANPPRRAYVVLLNDPAPRTLRPLLAIWPSHYRPDAPSHRQVRALGRRSTPSPGLLAVAAWGAQVLADHTPESPENTSHESVKSAFTRLRPGRTHALGLCCKACWSVQPQEACLSGAGGSSAGEGGMCSILNPVNP
ncbi:hypothetical protein ACWCOV_10130 [Kribbella sp. NPDC002412]